MSDKPKQDLTKPIAWLVALYAIAMVGLWQPATQYIFVRLIPVLWLVTLGFMLYHQKHWNMRIIAFCVFVFAATFAVQVVGVQSGKIFGVYAFGKSLGPKLWDVPVAMGVLWLILVYCVGVMLKSLNYHVLIKAAIGAGMLVMLDVLIEPVALKFGMWGFDKGRVPLMNYIAWYIISFPLILLFLNLRAKVRNELAPYAFCAIAGFFLVANLF
jgi:putative membrane protein